MSLAGSAIVNPNTPVGKGGVILGQIPQIVSAPAPSLQAIAAITNFINFTPPAVAGTYRMSWMVNTTVATTDNFHIVGTWDDAEGNEVSQTLGGWDKVGTALTAGAITNAIGTGIYYGFVIFNIDNSADAITLSTAGTFTTVTYDLLAVLEQLA